MNLRLLISTVGFEMSFTAIVVNQEEEKNLYIDLERERRGMLSDARSIGWVRKIPRIYSESPRVGKVFMGCNVFGNIYKK